MTADRRFEQDLPDLLADIYLGPQPDYRDDILRLVARTPQRPAWTFLERWLPMGVTTLVRPARAPLPWRTIGVMAVLALLVASLVAVYVGSRRPLPAPFGPAANGVLAYEEAGDIVVLDHATGTRTTIVGGTTTDTAPAFSRSGDQLAFLRQGAVGDGQSVWVSDADGSDQRQVAGGLEVRPFQGGGHIDASISWSPDGTSLLLNTASDAGPSITIVDVDGSESVRTLDVGMPAEGPSWRPPDGGEILFRGRTADGYGLFIVRLADMDVRPIVPAMIVPDEFDVVFFSWSPDGERIAYQRVVPDGPRLIHVVEASGGQPRPVTFGESVSAAWSPDGGSLVFLDASDPGGAIGVGIVGSDGSGLRRLPSPTGGSLSWAPDGRKILLHSEGALLLLDPLGGPAEPLDISSTILPDWQRVAP